MEPPVYVGVAFAAMAALLVWSHRSHGTGNRAVLKAWAHQHGHDWDEVSGQVTGRDGSGLVAGLRLHHEYGERTTSPVMTFPEPFALPESELRYRHLFGFTQVVHRLSGLRPLVRHDESFRARTHELLSTNPTFLEDAWALGIHDILARPTQPLSYRITPEGRLEIHCVNMSSSWNEQALSEAAAAGAGLRDLFRALTQPREAP